MTIVHKKSICFICAHPDDLIGSAGLAFLMKESGEFDLHIIDFTHGEWGLRQDGIPDEECAEIRAAEEKKACALLGAKLYFLDEKDGRSFAGYRVCEKMGDLLRDINPSLVTTHWPLDTHIDHVMCYATTMRALAMNNLNVKLLFFEESIQTRAMPVHYYVGFDESVMKKKMELVRCYVSQNTNDRIAERKLCEARYHGWKSEMKYAEPYGTIFQPDLSATSILSAFPVQRA